MEKKRYDVFISFSTADRNVVGNICNFLESNGYYCFVSYRDIPHGTVWAGAIADAIDNSKMMLVVFSDHFNKSHHTDRELELASENNMPILTYRIADAEFEGAKKYYLKNLNWIDSYPNPAKEFWTLLRNVRNLIGTRNQNVAVFRQTYQVRQDKNPAMKPAPSKGSQEFISRFADGITAFGSTTAQTVKRHWKPIVIISASLLGFLFVFIFVSVKNSSTLNLGPEGLERITTNYKKKDAAARLFDEGEENWNKYDEGGKRDSSLLKNAFKCWKQAADKGHAEAQYKVGYCYYYNRGVNGKDYGEAVKYFEMSRAQGHAGAAYCLGLCYLWGYTSGSSSSKKAVDKSKAIKLFEEAAKGGNEDAKAILKKSGQAI